MSDQSAIKNITPPTDEELIAAIQEAETALALCQKSIKRAKEELLNRHQGEIDALLKAKDEPFGAVPFTSGDFKITVTIPKKVEWNQQKLEAITRQIAEEGGKVSDYIDIEYNVAESKFKAWPENLRDVFTPARTVTPGNPAMKIEAKKD